MKEKVIDKEKLRKILYYTNHAFNLTTTTLRDGENLNTSPKRIMEVGDNIERVIDAIENGNEITFYMARSEESFSIIIKEGILNQKAIDEIRGIGRYDEPHYGSLYFRFNPESTITAIMYKNGCILRQEEEKKHIVFGVSMKLEGYLETDFLVVPSVSDPEGTNFIVRHVIDCISREILKTPFKETRFKIVGEFLYTLEKALSMFPDIPIDKISSSGYGSKNN